MATAENTLVRSLHRGLQTIDVVAVRGWLHVKPIACSLGRSLPTAYHLLRTLVSDGYLARLDDGSYVLAEGFGEGGYPPADVAPNLVTAEAGA